MKQPVRLMTDDADFVNVGARRWKGRAEIEAEHTQRLNQFRESTWSTNAVTVQFLKPDESAESKGSANPQRITVLACG